MSMNLTMDGVDLHQTPTRVTWHCLGLTPDGSAVDVELSQIEIRERYIAWLLERSDPSELVLEHIEKVRSIQNPDFSYT